MALTRQDQRPPSPAHPEHQPDVASSLVTRDRHRVRWLPPTLIVAGMIGAWQGAVMLFSIPAWKLPAPSAIAAELVASRSLYLRHTWVTLEEVVLGFGAAFVAGVLLATLIAYYSTFRRAIYPLVIASQTIPIIVIAPLLLIWIGYGIAPKIVVVVLIERY